MVVLRPLAASLLLRVLLGTGVASAQPSPLDWEPTDELAPTPYQAVLQTDQDCGLAGFRDGNARLREAAFSRAVDRYRAALRCWDHPAIHYSLALALINLDMPIQVAEELDAALAHGAEPLGPGPRGDRKLEQAREYRKLVEGQLGTIEITCVRVGAQVFLDNKLVLAGPGTYRTRVRVGRHEVTGELGEEQSRVRVPFIAPGETFRIELKLYRLIIEHRPEPRAKWPYAVIGAGVVLGAGGLALELSARSSYHEYDERVAACSSMGCSSSVSDLLALRNAGDTRRSIAFAAFGAAGAMIVTGAVFAYLERPRSRPSSGDLEQASAQPARPTTQIAPIVSPGMTGAMVQGHF
jgi:hypothetical protein